MGLSLDARFEHGFARPKHTSKSEDLSFLSSLDSDLDLFEIRNFWFGREGSGVYDHWLRNPGQSGRDAVRKLEIVGSVAGWVTTGESLLLHVLWFVPFLFSFGGEAGCFVCVECFRLLRTFL